jgi:hypothetical protein
MFSLTHADSMLGCLHRCFWAHLGEDSAGSFRGFAAAAAAHALCSSLAGNKELFQILLAVSRVPCLCLGYAAALCFTGPLLWYWSAENAGCCMAKWVYDATQPQTCSEILWVWACCRCYCVTYQSHSAWLASIQ